MFIKQHPRQEVVSDAVNEELVSLWMRTQDSMFESE